MLYAYDTILITLKGKMIVKQNENVILVLYLNRSDGSYSTAIRLPTSRAFYLLRFTSSCQKVIGMNVREEYVKTDDEDNNNANSVSGSHPLKSGTRNTQLHYCYYY